MFDIIAQGFYKWHYQEAIAPYLTNDQKLAIANKISALTLKAPIWTDRETNYIADFPELQGLVNTTLSGMYLCTLMAAIVDEFRNRPGLQQEDICNSCLYKQLKHTGWCYMFKEMFENCHQYKEAKGQ